MKNLFLLFITVSFLGNLHSQTTKGTWNVGLHNFSPVPLTSDGYSLFPTTNSLGISFSTSKYKYDGVEEGQQAISAFGLSVNSHYFVVDQLSLGLVGNFSSGTVTYKVEGEEDDKSSSTILLFGPELRYYLDAGAKTKIWLKGGTSFGSISSKYDGESSDPINLSQFGGGAGLSIFPMANVSIDLGLGYTVLKATGESFIGEFESINSGLSFDVGFGIFF